MVNSRVMSVRVSIRVTIPNFVETGRTVAKIWHFNYFQNSGYMPPSIFKNSKF